MLRLNVVLVFCVIPTVFALFFTAFDVMASIMTMALTAPMSVLGSNGILKQKI